MMNYLGVELVQEDIDEDDENEVEDSDKKIIQDILLTVKLQTKW